MVIKIIRRKPNPAAPAQEDALVADAVPASTTAPPRSGAESLKNWRSFVGPDAKPINCAFCGHHYYLPCKGDEHKGCMNFQAVQAKKAKEAGNTQPTA